MDGGPLHLVTFLGLGRYHRSNYRFPDGPCLAGHLFPGALVQYLRARHPDRPLSVHLGLTPQAHEAWKDRLGEIFPGAAGRLERGGELRVSEGLALHDLVLNEGKDPGQLWDNLRCLVASMPVGADLVLDVTHAFRSIPVQSMAAVEMMKASRHVRLLAVYYGAFEAAGRPEGTPVPVLVDGSPMDVPVFDLSQFVEASSWSSAMQAFRMTGSPALMAGQIVRDARRRAAPLLLAEWGSALEAAARDLELARVPALLESLQKTVLLRGAGKARRALSELPGPLGDLVREVVEPLAKLAPDNTNPVARELEFSFLLLDWYVRHSRWMQAAALMREVALSACMAAAGEELPRLRDRTFREDYARLLGHLNDRGTPPAEVPAAWRPLLDWWRDAALIRNTAMHCGYSSRSADKDLEAPTRRLRDRLAGLRPLLQAAGPELRRRVVEQAGIPIPGGGRRGSR